MKKFNYTIEIVNCIVVGLIDSDGCLSWNWNRADNSFVPSVTITLKTNPSILVFVKDWIGGYISSNGNWQHKTITKVHNLCIPILFDSLDNSSSCKLVSSRRYDGFLFLYVMTKIVLKNRQHRKLNGKAILIDMRRFLHFGKSRAGAKTPAELEYQLGLPLGFSTDTAKTVAESIQKDFETDIQNLQSKVLTGDYLNPWQVVGFFLGDGGVHIVWGTQLITTTITFTGDLKSSSALEYYAASLFRDGVYRKAWKSSKRDASRLIINGVNQLSTFVEPFVQNYPLPPCPKQEIVDKVLKTSRFLLYLKEKQNNKQIWSNSDWTKLSCLIQETWDLNPSGKARKFKTPNDYLSNLQQFSSKNKLKIR